MMVLVTHNFVFFNCIGEVTSKIEEDEIFSENDYVDIDIYDETLVVSINNDDGTGVVFYKLND